MKSSHNPILDAISVLEKLPLEHQFRGENLTLPVVPFKFFQILHFVSEKHYICSVLEIECNDELFGISGKATA